MIDVKEYQKDYRYKLTDSRFDNNIIINRYSGINYKEYMIYRNFKSVWIQPLPMHQDRSFFWYYAHPDFKDYIVDELLLV